MSRITLRVTGMHCASCANLITRALKETKGIESANVNLASEKATIDIDESMRTPEDVIDVIKKAGYGASETKHESHEHMHNLQDENIDTARSSFLWSLILSLPLVYMMMLDFFFWLPGTVSLPPYIALVSLVLATPVQFILGWRFYRGMWSALRMKTFSMDSLIAIGTSVAYGFSVVNYVTYVRITGSVLGLLGEKIPNLYFETSALLITFVLLGKWLEAKAKGKTSRAIEKLMGLQATTAHVIRDGKTLDVAISDVAIGETLLVRPGEKIPLDGTVVGLSLIHI